MVEHAYVREAKIDRQMAIIADANDLKEGSDASVGAARRAERDALEELRGAESVEGVEDVALPSERVDDEE